MKRCRRVGELRAFLDAELPAAQEAAVRGHLERCSACRDSVGRLQENRLWVQRRLDQFSGPGPEPALAPSAVLQRVKETVNQPNWKERTSAMFGLVNRKWRPALVALAVIVVFGISLSFAPVRALAEDFLSIFRVQEVALIQLGPEQSQRLQEIGSILEQNFFLADPVLEQEPEMLTVSSLAEAEAAAGYGVSSPGYLPDDLVQQPQIQVSNAAQGEISMDLEMARSLFEMFELDPALLPDSLGEQPLKVSVAPMVTQSWRGAARRMLTFVQGPSPMVEYPDDVDPEALGTAALQLLGMNEREAQRLARSIDWTSTLVIPVPTDLVSFREIQIHGSTGLLFTDQPTGQRTESALFWQQDGMLYFLTGNVSGDSLVEIADSMQ